MVDLEEVQVLQVKVVVTAALEEGVDIQEVLVLQETQHVNLVEEEVLIIVELIKSIQQE